MAYNLQKQIDFLLENANPSIKLRVKKEVLGFRSYPKSFCLQKTIKSRIR